MLKEKGHPIITQLTRDLVGAEAADDETVILQVRAEARTRRAAVCRRVCRSSRAPIIRRAISTRPRLEAPLGSGPYKVGRFESGRYIEYDRVKDWWGADLPIMRGQHNFDVVRFEFYRDRDVAFEGFTSKTYLFREEFTARIWATRYEFPATQGRTREAGDPSRRYAFGRAGLVHEYAAREVQEPGAARSAHRCVRFRVDQQDHHVRRLQAHVLGVPEFQHDGRGQAGARPSLRCSSRSAARCRTRCSASRSCRRSPTDRARTAHCCARRIATAAAGRLPDQGRQARRREGRAGHDRVPDRRADLPAAPHAVHQEPRRPRHRCDLARGRSGAVPQARRRIRLRHHGAALQFLVDARRLAAQLFLAPSRRR